MAPGADGQKELCRPRKDRLWIEKSDEDERLIARGIVEKLQSDNDRLPHAPPAKARPERTVWPL